MKRSRPASRSTGTNLRCEHCGERVRDVDHLLLLTATDRPPESRVAVTIHTDCADDFTASHPGSWERYAGRSTCGSWFLPLMVDWPASPTSHP
jgi:hypothetical protein